MVCHGNGLADIPASPLNNVQKLTNTALRHECQAYAIELRSRIEQRRIFDKWSIVRKQSITRAAHDKRSRAAAASGCVVEKMLLLSVYHEVLMAN